jgi:hypothetical protein
MMINDTRPVIIIPPEPRGPLAGVAAGSAVGAQAGNAAPEAVPVGDQPPASAQIVEERRQFARRAAERRKQKLQVLMDTRVSQRRGARRRAADEPSRSVDIEA